MFLEMDTVIYGHSCCGKMPICSFILKKKILAPILDLRMQDLSFSDREIKP